MEIEKKYTIKEIPGSLSDYVCEEIEQGYMLRSPVVRVRKLRTILPKSGQAESTVSVEPAPAGEENCEYILTVKQKKGRGGNGKPIVNREEEFSLDKEGYELMLSKCEGNIISKRRYLIPLPEECKGSFAGVGKPLVAELDIFSGKFTGLRFAEVEFESTEVAAEFVAPPWFDKDVSGDKNYSNGHLSRIL